MEQNKRSFLNLSKEQALSIFRKANKSDISDEDLYRGYQELALNDVQALLQEDIFGKYGGQLQTINFVPTFEMSMFISQLTGSIPITNSRIRWKEFSDHQHKELGIPSYNHQQLTNFLQTFNFRMSQDVGFVYENRGNKTIKRIRELFLELNNNISSPNSNKKFIKNFKSKFIANNKKQLEEFKDKDKDQYMYEAKLLFLIPNKGIVNNKVRRLLIQNTSDKCSMDVPIAIFISI